MYYIFIADIHGMRSELKDALDRCSSYMKHEKLGDRSCKYIFGGDLIDRGPHHSEVIKTVEWYVVTRDAILLWGNHDMMLVGTGDDLPYPGDDGKTYKYHEIWDVNEGLVTCMQMFGVNESRSTKDYAETIKSSKEYAFYKKHARTHFETDNIFFSHAPQSKMEWTPHTLMWGHSKDYTNQKGDASFIVPNNKILSVHGHMHRLYQKVNFPRVHNYTHGGINKAVVLADFGCGCGTRGRLHPVVLRDDGNDRPEIIAIL